MEILDPSMVWRQYAAAIDSLDAALRDCPDVLWQERLWEDDPDQWVAAGFSSFWYLGYHALFWVDLYLTGAEEGFVPPANFDLVEMDANETLPRVYSRAELLEYLELCRKRCQQTLTGLTPEQARRVCSFPWGELTFAELQLYAMRHVQEHAAQMHLFLGQRAGRAGG